MLLSRIKKKMSQKTEVVVVTAIKVELYLNYQKKQHKMGLSEKKEAGKRNNEYCGSCCYKGAYNFSGAGISNTFARIGLLYCLSGWKSHKQAF